MQTISACFTVRGKPSNRKPFLQAEESKFFSMSSTTISSLTCKHRQRLKFFHFSVLANET